MRTETLRGVLRLAAVVVLIGGMAGIARGGIITLQAQPLDGVLGTGYTASGSMMTTYMGSGNLEAAVYS